MNIEVRQEIQKLVEKYNQVETEQKFSKYNEEMTKKDFILPLFRSLGWNTEDSNEVTAEEKISKKRVDYGFKINGIPKFFLEAKALKEDLNNPNYIEQAINYAWHKGCTWAVLTNFEIIKILNAEWKISNPFQSHFITIACKEFLDKFDQLWLLSKESFEKELIDKEAEKWGKKTKKISVDEQLLADFTKFRELLSKNITKLNQNQNITEEELDEAVQRILDRLIFIRNCEDRELEEKTLISSLREWKSKGKGELIKSLREVFYYFDKEYNSKIFANHLCDKLDVENKVLQEVIEGLYFTPDNSVSYDFSAIESDVLGNIYEQYLGNILKKSKKRAKLTESHTHRKEQGIYYTPTYIVDYIVNNTLGELLKNKKPEEVEKIKVLDPACGSGSFLIKAFDVLNEYYAKNDKDYLQTRIDFKNGLAYTKKVEILEKNIFGVDLDKQAVEIAQLNLLLKISEKGQRLPLLQENIKCGNSLIDDTEIAGDKAFKWEEEFKQVMQEGGFDVVIGNPPYIRIQTLNKKDVDFFNSHYRSATKNYDIYSLFVEKGLSLLKDNGILGFILPSKFLNSNYGEGLRKVISEKKVLYKLVNFKDYQVFERATTYTCLLFLKKSKKRAFDYLEIQNKEKLKKAKLITGDIFKRSIKQQPKDEAPWNFVYEDSENIIKKLDNVNLRLKDVAKNIFQGLVTGFDKIFFVSLLEENKRYAKIKNNYDGKEHLVEREILKKLLKGKEIKKWRIDWQKLYIIYPYFVKNNSARLIPLDEIQKKYPKVYQYFLYYKKELKSRENNRFKNEKNWHQFGRLQNIEKFEQPKIMTQVLASKNNFTFDEKGEYYFVGGGNAGGYGITLREEYTKDSWILALLNSKLLEFYLKAISTPFRGGFYSYGKRFIERLPIKLISESQKKPLINLVDKILSLNKRLAEMGEKKTDERTEIEREIQKIENEINELVYNLYGITKEEKKIIEESLN